jgi:PAS domain S-box-containing protein
MNDRGVSFVARFCSGVSALAIAFGVLVLSGWEFHSRPFKTIIPGQVAVKANTAICFISLGVAFWLVRKENHHGSTTRAISRGLALAASLIGLLSFLEFWNSWNLGIDQLLFRAALDDLPGSIRPGLMSPLSGISFFLLGIVLASFDLSGRCVKWLHGLFISVAAIAGVFGILDFIFDSRKTHTHISPLTALLVLLMSVALPCCRIEWGLGALLVNESPGGEMSRRLLPAAVFIPLAIAWLGWKGQEAGWYSDWTGQVIMTVSAGFLLVSLVVWTALVIDRTDAARRQAEESAQNLAAIVTSSNDGIIGKTLDGTVTSWNPGAEAIYGYSAEEMIGQPFTRIIPSDLREEFEEFLLRLQRGESIRSYETQWARKDGTRISVSITVSPLQDAKGKIVGGATITRDISERKRAEQALAAERQRFRDVLDKLPAYVVLLTPDYHVALDNTVFRERFGESRGRPCYEFLFGRNAPCEICETYSVIKTGAPHRWKWTGPDGRHYDIFDFPFPDRDGSPLILEMGLDVTERERTESALQESEQAFRMLADLVPQLVWMCAPDGLNVYFNQRWVDYTGLALQESYGRGWNTPFHPDDKQPAWNAWNHAVATGDTYIINARLRAADGSYRWFLIKGVPMRGDSGAIIKWFGTCTDIDDLKRAEEEIRTLNRALEQRVEQRTAQLLESETRIRRKLDSILSPEGDLANLDLADILDLPAVQALAEDFYTVARIPMFIVDLKGTALVAVGWQEICTKFHRAHPAACQNCQESDLLLSQNVAAGEFKLYKCKNNMWDVVTPIVVGHQQIGNLFSGQFFFDDEPLDYSVFQAQAKHYGFNEAEYIAALERAPRLSHEAVNAGMAFFVKFAQLLSQLSYSSIKLARSTEQIGRANLELAAANKELEAFTYSVSHDLRAPLRHISGFSKLLTEDFSSSLPPQAQDHLQRIQEGTHRMGQLVDDLLNLARVGRHELSLRVAGLNSLVEEVMEMLKPDIENRRVEWRVGNLPFVECDPALLKQVLQNLLANALKFTRTRAAAVIEIDQREENGTSVIYVRDNGVGFSMKYADKLFGVFQRLHRQEDFEGTGVGLATVQRIIQKHGGRIWAEAELDKGATFYFTIGNIERNEMKAKSMAAGESS